MRTTAAWNMGKSQTAQALPPHISHLTQWRLKTRLAQPFMLTMPQRGDIHCQHHPKHHRTQESLTPPFDSRAVPTLSHQTVMDNWNTPQPLHRTGKVWKDDNNEQERSHREKSGKQGVRPVPPGVTPGLRRKPKEQAEGPYWLRMRLSSSESSPLLAALLQCLEDAKLQVHLPGQW